MSTDYGDQTTGVLTQLRELFDRAIKAGLWEGGSLEVARVQLSVRRQVANSKDLRKCTPESIARAALDAYSAGLMPDGREGYLIPRWNKHIKAFEAHFLSSWRGEQAIACEEGGYRVVTAEVVREDEIAERRFTWKSGIEPTLNHEPLLNAKGAIVAAYSVGFPKDGGPPVFSVADSEDLRAARETGGPVWKTHEAAMCRKTAVRRLIDRVVHTPTARARLAAARAGDDRMAALGSGESGDARAARLTSAVSIAPGEVVDEETGEVTEAQVEEAPAIAPPDPLVEEFNKKLAGYRDERAPSEKYAELQEQAGRAGLRFDINTGQYARGEE